MKERESESETAGRRAAREDASHTLHEASCEHERGGKRPAASGWFCRCEFSGLCRGAEVYESGRLDWVLGWMGRLLDYLIVYKWMG